jgi:hypothetical protein
VLQRLSSSLMSESRSAAGPIAAAA